MATARKLPSGSWRIRVYDSETKKYRSFTAGSKKAAEKMAADWLIDREIEKRCGMTFEAAANAYISDRSVTLSPTTIEGYRVIVKNNTTRFNSVRLSAITSRDVQDWVNELTVSKTPKTVRNVYGFFKAVLTFHDINLNLNKITLPQKQKKFKRLPTADIVLDAFKGSKIELPVLLAVWCGLRMSEILGIRRCDIDKDGILTINQVKVRVNGKWIIKNQTKTKKSKRQLRLPKQITDLLPDSDPIINIGYDGIYNNFCSIMKQQGYNITFHDLRHVNASVMAMLNIPDIYAMERGGWSNTTTLKQVYQQTFDDERNRIDRIIDRYFSEIYDTKYDTKNEIVP